MKDVARVSQVLKMFLLSYPLSQNEWQINSTLSQLYDQVREPTTGKDSN